MTPGYPGEGIITLDDYFSNTSIFNKRNKPNELDGKDVWVNDAELVDASLRTNWLSLGARLVVSPLFAILIGGINLIRKATGTYDGGLGYFVKDLAFSVTLGDGNGRSKVFMNYNYAAPSIFEGIGQRRDEIIAAMHNAAQHEDIAYRVSFIYGYTFIDGICFGGKAFDFVVGGYCEFIETAKR